MDIQLLRNNRSNSRIDELKIQNSKVTGKMVMPSFRNLILKSVKFTYPFKIDDNANPLEVIDEIDIENIKFECDKGQDGEFNKIKLLMKKIGL